MAEEKTMYTLFDGDQVDFDTAVMYMDDELREKVHMEFAPCTEYKFLCEYCKLHYKKYGEHFSII